MIVARRLLADRRVNVMFWTIGMVATVAFVVLLYPSIEGKAGFKRMVEQLPSAIKAIIGSNDKYSIISAEGYLHGRLFTTLGPMLLTIFGIGLGASCIAGDEGEGTLELLLANPVSRRRVASQRYLVLVALVMFLAAVAAVTTVALAALIGGSMGRLSSLHIIEAMFGSACLALFHASVAFAIGCVIGKRSIAVAAAAVVAIAGWLVQVITASVPDLHWLAAISPWRWYMREMIIVTGLNATATLLPLVLSAMCAVAGIAVFERRDLR